MINLQLDFRSLKGTLPRQPSFVGLSAWVHWTQAARGAAGRANVRDAASCYTRSVVCMSVCLLDTTVSSTKTTEPIEMDSAGTVYCAEARILLGQAFLGELANLVMLIILSLCYLLFYLVYMYQKLLDFTDTFHYYRYIWLT